MHEFSALLEEYRKKAETGGQVRQFRVYTQKPTLSASASIADAMLRFGDMRRTLVTGYIDDFAVKLANELHARKMLVPVASHGVETIGFFWAGLVPVLCATWHELKDYSTLPNVVHWHIYSRIVPPDLFRRQFLSMLRLNEGAANWVDADVEYVNLYLHPFA